MQSFRPISLASSFSKILEKIILGRLQWLARSQDWFSPDQHGFQSGKSTESAAHSLVTGIENVFSAKEVTACAFLDIKSAFDSAWHPAIMSAIFNKSCPINLIRIIRDFLTGRKAILTTHGISIILYHTGKSWLPPREGFCLRSFGLCLLMIFFVYLFHFPIRSMLSLMT